MASSAISPKRKRLQLSRKIKEENQNEVSTNTEQEKIRKKNFMTACLKVSYEAYRDKNRFQLLYLPECVNNTCNHRDRNANIKQISRAAEQSFKTEIKNKSWYEALEICQLCITSNQYLSASVLKDIVEIMMNAHEDLETGYTIDYLLRKCQHTLMMHFNMHPPCVTKDIRNCYNAFLTSPMDRNKLSNRKSYLSDDGIVCHCFSRLAYEVTAESSDGTLIEKQEIPADIEGVKRLHWKKENLELFELLERTERIERCMSILESVIYLVQTDIALFSARRTDTERHARSQLLLTRLMPTFNSTRDAIRVTWLCQKIMELFAHYIHLQYPERHIKTMGLWMNAVIQMLYTSDSSSYVDYPSIGSFSSAFAKEFYSIISPLPATSISRIIEKVQPAFMQHIIGLRHIQSIISWVHNDIVNVMIWCVNNMSWEDYPTENKKPKNCYKKILKSHKLLHCLSKKCKSPNVANNVHTDTYAKFELTAKSDGEVSQDYLIDLMFTTFVAYLESYSINIFNQTLEHYNNNGQQIDYDPTTCKRYLVTDCFVKKYSCIFNSLKELLKLLGEKKDDEPSRKLLDLINGYFS